jgi:copper transport protein
MGRSTSRRGPFVTLLAAALLLLCVGTASAHNSFVRSKPGDGAELEALPKRVSLTFAKAVPLDTIQVVLVQASGARVDAKGFRHGPGGEQEVIVPLGQVDPGPLTLRWRLVNSDGHVVSGRVRLAVAAPTDTGPAATSETGAALPATSAPPPPVEPPVQDEAVLADAADGTWTTPDPLRWFLRVASFLGMVVVVGALVTAWQVWPGAAEQSRLRGLGILAALVVALSGAVQLLLLAADLTGEQPFAAWGGMETALSLDAGRAYAVRAALGLMLALLLALPGGGAGRWGFGALVSVGALATWAFAGHASSQRWPWIGVPVDVVHHAAAAAWLGVLAMLAFVVFRAAPIDDLVDAVQRFSLIAATAVAAVVATGIVQSLRLVGDPSALLGTTHGRVLLAKLALLGVMLYVADLNRRRVRSRFRRRETVTRPARRVLQRAMLTEAAIGVAVLAVTAALVVQTPGASEEDGANARSTAPARVTSGAPGPSDDDAAARAVLLQSVVSTVLGGPSCADCPSPFSFFSPDSPSPDAATTTTSTTTRARP